MAPDCNYVINLIRACALTGYENVAYKMLIKRPAGWKVGEQC